MIYTSAEGEPMTPLAGRGHAFGQADLQVHTSHGDGMAGGRELLDRVEEHTDLSIIAITDHDDIDGALQTREAWARRSYSFEVIAGIEVSTREGHLLALDIDRPIPPFRSLAETLTLVHEAGGIAIVPHPMSWLTRSVGHRSIERVLRSADASVYFDGIEVENETLAARVMRGKARRTNDARWHLPETGGSDAHFPQAIGSAYTTFPGHTIAELRLALRQHQTRAVSGTHPTMRELGLGQIVRQQSRGLMVTPRNTIVRPLARRVRGSRAS